MRENMLILENIEQMKEVQSIILEYLQNSSDIYDNFDELTDVINKQKILNDHQKFEYFLRLLQNVTNNHRTENFSFKINKIILYLKNDLLQIFSENEIFQMFIKSKLILCLLFKNGIIKVNKNNFIYLIDHSSKEQEKNLPQYCHFFLPEIKYLIDKEQLKEYEQDIIYFETVIPENFDEKRFKGENDSYLCTLIRDNSIDEFISYLNQKNNSCSSRIKPSIFETNSFLIDKRPTLIEYFICIMIYHR